MLKFAAVRAFAFLLILAAATVAPAHPIVENAMEVVVARDQIKLKAKVCLVQIDIAQPLGLERGPVDPAKLKLALENHSAYLLSHLHFSADESPLTGEVKRITNAIKHIRGEANKSTIAEKQTSNILFRRM